MGVQRVLYSENGQSLTHVPPERVTAASWEIHDLDQHVDSSAYVVASGSLTVGAGISDLSLTTDGAAGTSQADPLKVPTSSTTGATEGTHCRIVAADGTSEAFLVAGVASGDYLLSEQELVGDYPSGSSVYGTLLSVDVPSAVYTDPDDDYVDRHAALRIVWTYAIDGRTRRVSDQIRVVRQDFGDLDLAAVELACRRRWPEMVNRVGGPDWIPRWVEQAARLTYGDMRRKDIRPELMLMGDALTDAIMFRTLCIAAENGIVPGGRDPVLVLEACETHYSKVFGDLTTGTPGVEVSEIDPSSGHAEPKSKRPINVIKGW